MRVLTILAGAAALAAAAGRYVLGADDLAKLGGEPIGAIVWHGLTYAMAVIGAAVVASAWAERQTATAMTMLATAVFGGIAAIMAVTAGARLGDPFAYYPFFVLAGVAALNAAAAARS